MLAALLLSMAPLAEPLEWHRYDVRVDASLTALDVRACFADGLPVYLVADQALAVEATRSFRYLEDAREVVRRPEGQAVTFRQPSDDGCIAWRTDLAEIAAADRWNIGYRAGDALVLAPGTWFWRPPVLTANRGIEFRFHLPAGMQVSVPWQPLIADGSDALRFRYRKTPLEWSSLMAIGKLEKRTFNEEDVTLRLAITNGPAKVDAERVVSWLRAAVQGTVALYGEFPVNDVQLLVVPLAKGYDAAPWAQTSRGGGAGAHFFMNAKADERMLRADWIATHELSHFALPYVRRGDAWLSEGFASYYQNVLRARAGALTERQAWQELHDGFMRGHRNTEDGTLREDSRYMHGRGRVMRVYWSGAAIALLADVELRRRTGGAWSLDRVLEEFNACCRSPEQAWSGRELFERFDAISGTGVFDALYRRHVHSRHFPRVAETFAALGIVVNDGQVVLRDDAPLRHLRTQITGKAAERVAPAAGTAGDGRN